MLVKQVENTPILIPEFSNQNYKHFEIITNPDISVLFIGDIVTIDTRNKDAKLKNFVVKYESEYLAVTSPSENHEIIGKIIYRQGDL